MKTVSLIMNAYVCRPGITGIVIDHRSPSGERVIGALRGFQLLKSPTTDTLCAVPLRSTNWEGIGAASGDGLATVCIL